jgi:hypothetical protein
LLRSSIDTAWAEEQKKKIRIIALSKLLIIYSSSLPWVSASQLLNLAVREKRG